MGVKSHRVRTVSEASGHEGREWMDTAASETEWSRKSCPWTWTRFLHRCREKRDCAGRDADCSPSSLRQWRRLTLHHQQTWEELSTWKETISSFYIAVVRRSFARARPHRAPSVADVNPLAAGHGSRVATNRSSLHDPRTAEQDRTSCSFAGFGLLHSCVFSSRCWVLRRASAVCGSH